MQAGPSTHTRRRSDASSLSASSLIDDLDEAAENDNFDWKGMRERRLEALKQEVKRNEENKDHRHGRLSEVTNEKELIGTSAKQRYCVIHFFKPDFTRCAIMDKHLSILADKHRHTLFLKANVENTPFLTTRLGVKVLPCVVCFVEGNAVDRLVGFDDLGNTDTFTTKVLEMRLTRSGVLPAPGQVSMVQAQLAQRKATSDESDQEDDDDAARDKAGRRKIVQSVRGGTRRGRNESDDDEYA